MVFFTYSPEQLKGYWLDHYFPEMIRRAMEGIPGLEEMEELLAQTGFGFPEIEKYFVHPDVRDYFLYAFKFKPEAYLDDGIRNNTSAFRLFCTPQELEVGLERLQADIQSGTIQEVIKLYDNDLGDYLFLTSVCL